MVDTARIIHAIAVGQNLQVTYVLGEEIGERVVIEIKDNGQEFEDGVFSQYLVLDEDGQLIASIENMPVLVEYKTIAVDGPVGEVSNG